MTRLTELEIRSCIEGNSQALRKCIEVYGKPVAYAIGLILKNRDEYEECYWRMMNRLPELLKRYDPVCTGRNLAGLLSFVARNEALQCKRKTKTGVLASNNIVSDKAIESMSDLVTPESLYLASEVRSLIESTLDALEIQADREILVFKYVHGYRVEELAKVFSINPQSVNSKLDRARKRFKKKFRELFPEWYEEYKR